MLLNCNGVETREINQALRNNPKKFLPGYVIELNNNEKEELIKNFDRFKKLKHSTVFFLSPHDFFIISFIIYKNTKNFGVFNYSVYLCKCYNTKIMEETI